MPQRILFAINSLGIGGAERQLLYLLSHLDRQRFEAHVVTVFDEHSDFYVERLAALGVTLHTLAHGPLNVMARARALVRYVVLAWRLRPRIVQGYLHHANLIVRVCRPMCPPHILLTSARVIYRPGEMRSEALTFWLDDGLIVNSPAIAQQVLAHTRRKADRIATIPNGIPIEDFSANPDPDLRAGLFPAARLVVGMVGRIAYQKDHPTLLEAVHLVRAWLNNEFAVFLLGDVSEPDAQQRVEDMMSRYRLEKIVTRLPAVREVAAYYFAADALVLPSRWEGFPNVILEAFAAGRPVIVSEDADTLGLVQHGETGWRFPTGDAAALAECIRLLWETPQPERASMGRAGRAVAATFSVASTAEEYMQLYDRHMGRS